MAISIVQSTTGNGATIALNGVTAGNTLIFLETLFRGSSGTSAAIAVPTDTQGTWSTAIAPTLVGIDASINWCGVGIFYQENVAAGTHTLTPASATGNGSKWMSLLEVSGLTTSSVDKTNSGSTANTSHTSRTTQSTGVLTQADEISFIAHAMGASIGVSDCGYTDPVTGYTTVKKVVNSLSDIATFHAYKIVSATTALNETFNWTASETNMGSQAAIATFMAAAGGANVLMGQVCT
jgi:hypothetical protein